MQDQEKIIYKKTEDPIEDDYNELDIPERAEQGDIWLLGQHRVVCGDSTDREAIQKLMNGERADIMFTSPPYNMGMGNFSGTPNVDMRAGKAYDDYADNVTDKEYGEMLSEIVKIALEIADDALLNIGILKGSKKGICEMLYNHKDKLLDILIWNKKSHFPLGMESQKNMVAHRSELIFCFNQTGNRNFTHAQWSKGEGVNQINTEAATSNEYASVHNATFPVRFAWEVIKNYTENSVVDLFGGTGTTLIAAEQLGRKSYIMELSPKYVDIIIDRWEKFTGEKAVKA